MSDLIVLVNGALKGTVTFTNNRYQWWRQKGGVDPLPKGITLDEIRAYIGRICLADPKAVRLVPEHEMLEETNKSLHQGNKD